MSVSDLLSQLRANDRFMRQMVAWERLPARSAQSLPYPAELSHSLRTALASLHIHQLYTHQVEAFEHSLRGENTVIVTGTASGKTLCYNLPVLQSLLTEPNARALYLFPTRALAQDQLSNLNRLLNACSAQHLSAAVYDGDTPQAPRKRIREQASVILSNPDMLHMGILPHHPRWSAFFAGLRYVVIDELHTYRGIFGSHVANLFRRLRRICQFYGANPQFICTSATIGNPQMLAQNIISAPVQLVAYDGSPRAEKNVLVYNPPEFTSENGVRRAYTLDAVQIASECVQADVQTALFARARVTAELMLGYLRQSLLERGVPAAQVRGYRGGYLAEERREIESGLRNGSVRAVVATNALELGVDIGELGAVVVAGYPGTIASLWQQAGRAGRRDLPSVVFFVASGAPLDQYLALHPRYIFDTSPEQARINPDNLAILFSHLRCALFELPFESGEGYGAFPNLQAFWQMLAEQNEAYLPSEGELAAQWVGNSYPAEAISLRTSGNQRVLIQDSSLGRAQTIGEIDGEVAPVQVHAGAVYLHEGKQYLVEQLDLENNLAKVRPTEVEYYTLARSETTLQVLAVTDANEYAPARRAYGSVLVNSQPIGFRRIKLYTHEVLSAEALELPKREYETNAFWLWFSPQVVKQLQLEGVHLLPNDYGPNWASQRNAARARDSYRCQRCGTPENLAAGGAQHHVHHICPFRLFGYISGENDHYLQANALENLLTLCPACHRQVETAPPTALSGLEHALLNLAPLFLMCDPGDLSALHELKSTETGAPTLYIFERNVGGIGFSECLFEKTDTLLQAVAELLAHCPCANGCPACVGPVLEDYPESLSLKETTRRVVSALLEAGHQD